MKKIIILITLLFTIATNAQKVSVREARIAAEVWLDNYSKYFEKGNYELRSSRVLVAENEQVAFVFEILPQGYVLVATDKRITPVVGFSFRSKFPKDENVFLNWFVREDLKSRLNSLKQGKAKRTVVEKNISEWNKLLNGASDKNRYDIIGPFVMSNWSQGYVNGELVFNYYTPNHWSAGCVATAMAQVLNYYKWPLRGTGYHSYYENDAGTLSADYGNTWYDWANTLDDYENNVFNLAQQKAAGLLTFHAAVSVNMDFGSQGSEASTSDVPYALHSYFRHSGHYSSVNSSGFWSALKNNMLDLRPAILSIKRTDGFGHAAVVDGYFEQNNYYHLNPGWGGNYDGWYDISGDWNMSGYTIVVGAAKGIVPSPMVNDITRVSELSFDLSWSVSRYQYADYYEVQQSQNYGGPWTTISSSVPDTVYRINVSDVGTYYYRVRARRDNIWWDWSKPKKVQLGSERSVTFRVKLPNGILDEDESFVLRGNIPPLSGNENSEPFQGPDTAGVYSLAINFDFDYVGDTLIYRFFIDSSSVLIPENQNRYYAITAEASQILPVAVFNYFTDVVEDEIYYPQTIELYQNYPNPFNPTTTITYVIASPDLSGRGNLSNSQRQFASGGTSLQATRNDGAVQISLKIYDVLGREVATLVNKKQVPGKYSVQFDANSVSGGLPSGIYYYSLRAGNFIQTKKMILLK